MTLSAVMQHIAVLEAGGLVHSEKGGRVRTCYIEPATIRMVEHWATEPRAIWEHRLDRLGNYLAELPAQPEQRSTSMHEPEIKLDSRFSDPSAVATEWEQTRGALQSAELFWITTVRADGRPHVTPLVAVWLDDALHFSTGATEQKAMNIRGNPHVVLTTGCNTWDQGLDVVVEGDARRVTDDDQLKRLAAAWATKWQGQWRFEVRDGRFENKDHGIALVFSVTPTKIFACAKGTFSQTRYRF
jgi:nitroimidazol reductase NimA-like FMN-containing flavoprotein (pyridoxamine 5'-phosphate oxidase superfamily)